MAGILLFWPLLVCEVAVEGMVAALRLVSVSASGVWPGKRDSGIGVLFSQVDSIPKPAAAHQYQMSYEAAALLAERQSLSELRAALRRFLPMAQSESEWGALDAVADEIQKRDEQKPVL